MVKRTRTILFVISVILFLTVAPSVILYSQGWRFDLNTKRIVKIGGLYFKVYPKRANVFVNGKAYKTDYFFGTRFIEGLLPGEYQITIEKEGFLPWKKKLKVEEEKTCKAENIFLIPVKVNFEILTKKVRNLFFTEKEGKMLLLSENKGWELKVLGLKENLIAHLLEEKDIQENAELEELVFSPNLKDALIKIKAGKASEYFLLNLGNASLAPLGFLDSFSEEISFSEDGEKIFFLRQAQDRSFSENELFEAVLEEKTPSLLLENVVTYQLKEGSIHYLDSSGFLFKTDPEGKRKEKLSRAALELQEEKNYKIYAFSSFIFLKEGDSLFLLNPEGLFEKIFDGLKGIKISPDSKKLVFFSEHEIWLFFLEKIEEQPLREKGERLFLARFSEKLNDVFWLASHYLVFNVGEKIKVCETDERDKIQIWDLEGIEAEKFFFSYENKTLYFLKEGNLFVTEKLIK